MFAKKQTSFPCDICPKSYKQFNTLKNHKSAVHKVEVQNWKSEKENFRGVTITPRQTTTRGSLRKIVSCNVCGTQFQSVEQLAKHLVSGVHGTDKCNICQKKFSSVHFLAKHLVSGDHGKDKEARKPVKNDTKVVDVIDVDLEEEPLKFNIPQIVKKVDTSKKRKSAGDEIAIKKKAKVDKVIVDDEPRHWLDKMMKEVDDFSTNLLSLIGDVRKTWGSGVKNDQCVTEATEKLREVLMISKNYIELIDKSVIDEYWANQSQSGLWGQIPSLDEVPAPVLDEGANMEDEATLEEAVDDNGDAETVCTPDLPDMEALEADVDINLDGEPVFESLEESSEVTGDNFVAGVEDLTNSSENSVNDEELTNNCDDETVDESVSNTNEETAANLVIKTDNEDKENDDSIEDLSENECKLKPSEDSVLEVDTHSEEHSKKNDMDEVQLAEDKQETKHASEEEVTSQTEEEEKTLHTEEEYSQENRVDEEQTIEAEENNDQDQESEETAEIAREDLTEEEKEPVTEKEKVKEAVTEEEKVKEEATEEDSKEQTEKGNSKEDIPSDLPKKESTEETSPSTGMFLFASWCQ